MRRWWPWLALAALLLLATSGTLLDGKVLAIGDGLAQDFPLRLLAARTWLSGSVPFWNPYGFGGMPLLATMHVGVFFPGNLPFLLLPPVVAMNASVLLALWTAGAMSYLLARAQGLSRQAAFVSGLVFMGSGFVVAHIENLQMLQAAALMPGLLWAIARHAQARDARYALAFAGLLGLQVLAGHPQMVVFTGLVAMPYALYLAVRRARGTRLAFLLSLGAGAALGLGLAGLQLLPALDFIPRTQRHAFTYEALTFRSMPERQLISLWLPYLFGGYGTGWVPQAYWGGPHQTDLTGYAGLVSLVLAALAGLAMGGAGFWWAIVVAGALLAVGGYLHAYQYWALLPVIKSLPAPGRHLLLLDVGVAVLAGMGFEALKERANARRAVVAWGLVGLPLVGVSGWLWVSGPAMEQRLKAFMPDWITLAGAFSFTQPAMWLPVALWLLVGLWLAAAWRRERVLQAGVLLLLGLDLGFFALNQGWAARAFRLPTPAIAPAPELSADEARSWPRSAIYVYPYQDFENVRSLHYPNWGGLVGVRTLNGYDAFIPDRYARLMGQMGSTGLIEDEGLLDPAHHGLDVLGVRTVLLDDELARDPAHAAALHARGCTPGPLEPGARAFRNPHALPRAWRLAETVAAPPAEVDRHLMADRAFDPARTGYLDAPARSGTWSPGSARLRASGPNTLALETMGAGPGFVAVSEGYDPGWRAYLADRRELPVLVLDGLVMGVEVPAGAQHVTLRYEPRAWRVGLGLSLGSLAVLLLWGLELRRRARQQPT